MNPSNKKRAIRAYLIRSQLDEVRKHLKPESPILDCFDAMHTLIELMTNYMEEFINETAKSPAPKRSAK